MGTCAFSWYLCVPPGTHASSSHHLCLPSWCLCVHPARVHPSSPALLHPLLAFGEDAKHPLMHPLALVWQLQVDRFSLLNIKHAHDRSALGQSALQLTRHDFVRIF